MSASTIESALLKFKSSIPSYVDLVAVSKTKPNEDILRAYNAGQRIFGENKIQDLVQKQEALPKDIKWHFIGHLQTNKVKYIAPFISLIHAIDSIKLLREINKRAEQNERTIDCLLQVKIAQEDSKFGIYPDAVENFISSNEVKSLSNISINGLMGMASNTANGVQVKNEFEQLNVLYNRIKSSNPAFQTLSMGMSGDYRLAIDEGSNMIRVGSSIFGARNYSK